MVQRKVHKAEEEGRRVKAVAMNKQGNWTRWESVRERALTWQNIWSMEGHRIKFLLCSMYVLSECWTHQSPTGISDHTKTSQHCAHTYQHNAPHTHTHTSAPLLEENTGHYTLLLFEGLKVVLTS